MTVVYSVFAQATHIIAQYKHNTKIVVNSDKVDDTVVQKNTVDTTVYILVACIYIYVGSGVT